MDKQVLCLASLYSNTGKLDKAEDLYLEALKVYCRLAEEVSRAAYESSIAMVLYMLQSINRTEKFEKCFAEAKQLAEKYKDINKICREILDRPTK